MCVSSSAAGGSPSSAATSVSSQDCGPGSTSTSPTCQQQITLGRPRWLTSMARMTLQPMEPRRSGYTRRMAKADEMKGRIKQAAGDLIGDAELRRKGKLQQRQAEAREEQARAEDEADRKAEEV